MSDQDETDAGKAGLKTGGFVSPVHFMHLDFKPAYEGMTAAFHERLNVSQYARSLDGLTSPTLVERMLKVLDQMVRDAWPSQAEFRHHLIQSPELFVAGEARVEPNEQPTVGEEFRERWAPHNHSADRAPDRATHAPSQEAPNIPGQEKKLNSLGTVGRLSQTLDRVLGRESFSDLSNRYHEAQRQWENAFVGKILLREWLDGNVVLASKDGREGDRPLVNLTRAEIEEAQTHGIALDDVYFARAQLSFGQSWEAKSPAKPLPEPEQGMDR